MLLSNVRNYFGCANLWVLLLLERDIAKIYFFRGAAEPFTFTMPPLARLVQLPRLERQHVTLTLTLTLRNPNPAQPLSQELTFQRLLWRVAQRFGSTSLLTFTKMLLAAVTVHVPALSLTQAVKCLCLNLFSTTCVQPELSSWVWEH